MAHQGRAAPSRTEATPRRRAPRPSRPLEYANCSASAVSAHFFSRDGRSWGFSPQPYGHTVQYDDGVAHSHVTLERPNLHFDEQGVLTHINLAADLVTGDAGCANRTDHAHFGHCPCDNLQVGQPRGNDRRGAGGVGGSAIANQVSCSECRNMWRHRRAIAGP